MSYLTLAASLIAAGSAVKVWLWFGLPTCVRCGRREARLKRFRFCPHCGVRLR